jgi:hypothetical protein
MSNSPRVATRSDSCTASHTDPDPLESARRPAIGFPVPQLAQNRSLAFIGWPHRVHVMVTLIRWLPQSPSDAVR